MFLESDWFLLEWKPLPTSLHTSTYESASHAINLLDPLVMAMMTVQISRTLQPTEPLPMPLRGTPRTSRPQLRWARVHWMPVHEQSATTPLPILRSLSSRDMGLVFRLPCQGHLLDEYPVSPLPNPPPGRPNPVLNPVVLPDKKCAGHTIDFKLGSWLVPLLKRFCRSDKTNDRPTTEPHDDAGRRAAQLTQPIALAKARRRQCSPACHSLSPFARFETRRTWRSPLAGKYPPERRQSFIFGVQLQDW